MSSKGDSNDKHTFYAAERWRGEVTNELRHIADAVRRLEHQLLGVEERLVTALRDHAAYHERNEERWGPVRWCQRHPFRLALVVGGVMAWWLSTDSAIGRVVLEALARGLR